VQKQKQWVLFGDNPEIRAVSELLCLNGEVVCSLSEVDAEAFAVYCVGETNDTVASARHIRAIEQGEFWHSSCLAQVIAELAVAGKCEFPRSSYCGRKVVPGYTASSGGEFGIVSVYPLDLWSVGVTGVAFDFDEYEEVDCVDWAVIPPELVFTAVTSDWESAAYSGQLSGVNALEFAKWRIKQGGHESDVDIAAAALAATEPAALVAQAARDDLFQAMIDAWRPRDELHDRRNGVQLRLTLARIELQLAHNATFECWAAADSEGWESVSLREDTVIRRVAEFERELSEVEAEYALALASAEEATRRYESARPSLSAIARKASFTDDALDAWRVALGLMTVEQEAS
jgi:hypothetical protein